MRFDKVVDGGVTYVRLNLEGFSLPQDLPFDPTLYLDFRINNTYKILSPNQGKEDWDVVYKYPEMFLNQLSDDDKTQIVGTMVYMHYLIRSILNADHFRPEDESEAARLQDKREMLNLQHSLAKCMCALNDNIHLLDKLWVFTQDNIKPTQPEGNIGERAQDSPEKTLWPGEQQQIASLTIMAKLFSPLSSVFINCCKDLKLDSSFYEVHCNMMYRPMLDEAYPELMEKLDGIIRSVVEKKLKDSNDTDVYTGHTPSTLTAKNIAAIFTRKLVVVNLEQKGTNLATYIHACVKSTTNSSSGNKHKLSVMSRQTPTDNLNVANGDGNESIFETESVSSARTADFEVTISFAVDTIVKQYLARYSIDKTAYIAAMLYYDTQGHMVVDPVNSYVLGIMFGPDLMGGRSVELLKSTDLSRLVALAQLLLIEQGYAHELVCLISAVPTGKFKNPQLLTGAEASLKAGWKNFPSYRNCDNKFPFTCNGIKWDTGLENIVKALTETIYINNVAPVILEYMEEVNNNNAPYVASSVLSDNICKLILEYTDGE